MSVETAEVVIDKKVRAIVQFGPATPSSGMRPAEYFQVTIDPNMVSPSGKFIRFDQSFQGGEMHGWQRIEALTVCEVLGDAEDYKVPEGYTVEAGATVTMKAMA